MFFKENTSKPKIEVLQECVPEVVISKEAIMKMKLFIEGCDEEIGWLGSAHQNKDFIYISDVFLFEQEVHSTTTEITPEGLGKFAETILQLEEGVEIWNSIKVWGHSHVRMSTSPSGQDDKQMVVFKDSGHDWFIRIIGNKNGALTIDIYNYDLGIIYRDVKWEVLLSKEELEIQDIINQLQIQLNSYDEELEKSLSDVVTKDITEKVSKKVSHSFGGYKGNSYGYLGKVDTVVPIDTKGKKKKKDKKKEVLSLEEVKRQNIDLGIYEKDIVDDVACASSVHEVREVLDMWGFEGIYDVYTDEDINDLWHISIKLAMQYASEEAELAYGNYSYDDDTGIYGYSQARLY